MDYILEPSVQVGKNVTIQPYAVVRGNSVLCDGCTIGSFSVVEDSQIGEGSTILSSRVCNSCVGAHCTVGPNAHLRGGTQLGENCRIGNFVEVKNSRLGNGVKAAHLSYLGDGDVGDNTNIGCGTVFVNFDGKTKHRTVVGKNCFVGCNSNLVAPVTLGDNCFVACGSTVDCDVPSGAFVIARSRPTLKLNRANKYMM